MNYNPYVYFQVFNDINELYDSFIKELLLFSDVTRKLHHILTTIQSIKVNFKKAKIENKDCFLIFIISHRDSILEKLADKYQFPRGFPIIWIPKEILHLYGFYPKFKNDNVHNDNYVQYNEINKITFNYKYSGFLGQIISFKINENYYYTTCSKNGSGTIFSEILYKIIQCKINLALLKYLTDNCLHLCGEVISFDDQTHGSTVIEEHFIITLLAKGHKIVNTIITEECCKNSFLEYQSSNILLSFCKEYNFSIDSIFTIYEKENVLLFLENLKQLRNEATLDKLNKLLDTSNVFIETGTIKHKNILGNILEGLIVKMYKDGSEYSFQLQKIKFPFYTVRTMFLRTMLDSNNNNISSLKQFKKDTNRFIERWVINDDKKHFWCFFLDSLFTSFSKYSILYDLYIENLLKEKKETLLPSNRIHKHIYIMDLLMEDIQYDETKIYRVDNTYRYNNINQIQIILTVGPIGYGKSTFSEKLYQLNTNKYQHIDGDILDLQSDTDFLSRLSFERNSYTKYKIIQSLQNGKIPILSLGGGIFLEKGELNQEIVFFTQLIDLFQTNCIEIILCLPTNSIKNIKYRNKIEIMNNMNLFQNLHEIYYNDGPIQESLMYRIKNQLWKLPKNKSMDDLGKEIIDKSKRNLEIVQKIICTLQYNNLLKGIIEYPMITNENYHNFYDDHDIKEELLEINTNILNTFIKINDPVPVFTQQRLLCFIPNTLKIHHITLFYNDEIKTIINDKYDFLENTEIMGTMYKLLPLKPNKEIIFLIIDGIIDLPTAHITINPGNHCSGEMIHLILLLQKKEETSFIIYNNINYKVNKSNKLQRIEMKKIMYIM